VTHSTPFDTLSKPVYKTPMKKYFLLLIICAIGLSSCSVSEVSDPVSTKNIQAKDISNSVSDPSILSPTPTLIPQSPLDQGEQALFAGEFDIARQAFQNAYDQSTDSEIKAKALLGIGRSYYIEQSCSSAMDAFNRILGQFASSNSVAPAYFLLGQCYSILDDYGHAKDAFMHYLQLKPGILDGYIYEIIGNDALAAGKYNEAITAFQNALQSNPLSNANSLNLKIGQAYAANQDYNTAIQIYQSIYDNQDSNFYDKASADLLIGQAYLALKMDNQAFTQLMDAVIQFPRAYDSYTSLTILIEHDVPVDNLLKGIVDYYAGQYQDAIKAFDAYVSGKPQDDGTVYYYRGLSYYFLNQGNAAIRDYDQLIQNYPNNHFWASAWDEKAYVQWAVLGEYNNAANTLLEYISRAPKSSEAPGYLFEAGRILERNDDLENAAKTWLRSMDEFPNDASSYHALFLAGITQFRLGKYDDALTIFRRCAVLTSDSGEKAASYLWIGKSFQAKNDPGNARSFWQQAQRADPTNYYGIRAGELIDGLTPLSINALYDFGYDLNYERPEAESWVRNTFKLPNNEDLSGLGELATDIRIQRGEEYWQFGLYSQSSVQFESVEKDMASDPANTYRLINFFYSIGLYRPAINACRNLLNLAGMDDLSSLSAPIFFTHIRFGAYFRKEVVQTTNDENLNPLVLYALLRQESLFEPFITSSAGAQGLGQIMPATGKEISDQMGYPPNYSKEDLTRANVSIVFAAYYLARQQRYFNGDLFAALAAYNAGAGSSKAWKDLSQNDPDLFLEIIRTEETQTYLKQIIEFLNVYKLVYTHPQ
jgi:soluble lytic murein transglycosylase